MKPNTVTRLIALLRCLDKGDLPKDIEAYHRELPPGTLDELRGLSEALEKSAHDAAVLELFRSASMALGIGAEMLVQEVTALRRSNHFNATHLRPLLAEAGYMFRHYEELHRAKGPGHEEKVERNKDLADRIMAALEGAGAHADDLAVDRFAAAMKAKMAKSRAKGRGGWDDPQQCSIKSLFGMLVQHIAKGDPVDIGNFAMMLHQRQAQPNEIAEWWVQGTGRNTLQHFDHGTAELGDREQAALDYVNTTCTPNATAADRVLARAAHIAGQRYATDRGIPSEFLTELINECEIGDIDESCASEGWAAIYRRAKELLEGKALPSAPATPRPMHMSEVTHPKATTPEEAWMYATGWNDCIVEMLKLAGGSAQASPNGPGCVKPDTDKQVFFYEQDFYVLSNFSSFSLFWEGIRFQTSEAAYHWEKFPSGRAVGIRNAIRFSISAHEAFKIAEARKAERRPDWDEVKLDVMLRILRAKVDQHEYVRRKLLATGDRELIEDSWRDAYWGWGPNRDGLNMLGKLWMQIRAELRAEQGTEGNDHG